MFSKKKKLCQFQWEGKDRAGNFNKGVIEEYDIKSARRTLQKDGFYVKKINKKLSLSMNTSKGKKVKSNDIAFFMNQMSTMIKSGISMVKALDLVAGSSEKKEMKLMIESIKDDVSSGSELSASLAKHDKHFDKLTTSLIASGEKSGALDRILSKISEHKEKSEALKKKIKKAMTYPIAVIFVGMIVSAILLIKVIPQFESVFAGFGSELPAFTQFVVNLSEIAQAYWFYAVAFLFGAFFVFKKVLLKITKVRNFIDTTVLKIPVFGQIIYNAAIARFASTMAISYSSGVPVVSALRSAADASGNFKFEEAINQIANNVEGGQPLSTALSLTGVFPNLISQMVDIGEESGALDDMLNKASQYYEEQVDHAVDTLSDLMEPIILSFLAIIVGGLVIAMYLPIFMMGSVV